MAFSLNKKRVFEITSNNKKDEATWNAMAESQEEMDAIVQGVFNYVANLITTNIHEHEGDAVNEVKGAFAHILAQLINQLADLGESEAIQSIAEFVREAGLEEHIQITEADREDREEE